jgi:hypothetical protein
VETAITYMTAAGNTGINIQIANPKIAKTANAVSPMANAAILRVRAT